ncbi:hypothetical protein F5Y15DRAFT_292781 [Xylariaceae sp. FL0016]|nr:hypothetical protein F5Y15DRAFT_292781 [Xylariaceae sp. FL0016]
MRLYLTPCEVNYMIYMVLSVLLSLCTKAAPGRDFRTTRGHPQTVLPSFRSPLPSRCFLAKRDILAVPLGIISITASLILHIRLPWRRSALLPSPALRWGLILHRYVLAILASLTAPVLHVLYIRSILKRLGEIADVADNILVAVDGERKDGLPAAQTV